MRIGKTVQFALTIAALCSMSQVVQAFDYSGKTVTIVVNQAAGGSTDIRARLLARHLSRMVPGHPTFIVQNMGGASGAIAANWLGEVAQADGMMMGYLREWPRRLRSRARTCVST